MRNGRCRFHGGRNPGAPKGNVNGLIHGARTAAAGQENKANTGISRSLRAIVKNASKLAPGRPKKGQRPTPAGSAFVSQALWELLRAKEFEARAARRRRFERIAQKDLENEAKAAAVDDQSA